MHMCGCIALLVAAGGVSRMAKAVGVVCACVYKCVYDSHSTEADVNWERSISCIHPID